MNPTKQLLLLLLLFGAVEASARQYPKMRYPLSGNIVMGFTTGTPINFSAGPTGIVLSQLNTATRRSTYQNTVELVLKNHSALDEDAKVTVKADLRYYPIDGSAPMTSQITLEVDWKAAALTRSSIAGIHPFKDAYKADLKITDVVVTGASGANIPQLKAKLASFVEVVMTFQEERVTAINYNTVPASLTACLDQVTDELVLSWAPHDDAEEYELEYTFADDYTAVYGTPRNPSAIRYDFRKNSTRIRLKDTYYRFPLLLERGYILYRIRAIGWGGSGIDQPVYCRWSGGSESGFVNGFPDSYYHGGAHVSDRINWQVASTFAEDGKRSDAVQYFDGTFRARQTVTGMNIERRGPTAQGPLLVMFTPDACAQGSEKQREVIAG